MDVDINIDTNNMKIDCIMLQKMIFIHNALDKGWAIKKKDHVYVFTKNHQGKKEVMLED